jgi:hypothetical protein
MSSPSVDASSTRSNFAARFDIEPDARTVAEIMADEDTASAKYEPLSTERALVFVEYERVARRALRRLRVERRSASKPS